jgi:hypothetical protein
MKGANRPITSREYKLMLNVDRFGDRKAGIQAFARLFEFLVDSQGGEIVERQKNLFTRRTWYLDTPYRALRTSGLVLRVRKQEAKAPPFKVTLKFRALDRYVSSAQDLSVSTQVRDAIREEGDPAEITYKFEEDILPRFSRRFSHSVSIETDNPLKLKNVGHARKVFPALDLPGVPAKTALVKVNRFVAHEVVRWLAQFDFGEPPVVKACLSFWYLSGKKNEWPVAAEFSYDYDLPGADKLGRGELERYPAEVVRGTNDLLAALEKQSGWVNLDATTKTAYAYQAF